MSVISIASSESGKEVTSRSHPSADNPVPLAIDFSDFVGAGEYCRGETRQLQLRAKNIIFLLGLSKYIDQPSQVIRDAGAQDCAGSSSPHEGDGMRKYFDAAARQEKRREAARRSGVSHADSALSTSSNSKEPSGSKSSDRGTSAGSGGAKGGLALVIVNHVYVMDGQKICELSARIPAIGLKQIRKDFAIPDSVELHELGAGESVTRQPPGKVAAYKKKLVEGLRLPLHPWLADGFNMYNIAPSPVGTNPLRQLIGLYALFYFCHFGEPTMEEVAHLLKIGYSTKSQYGGTITLTSRSGKNAFVKDLPTSVPDWRNQVFLVSGD